MNLGGTRVRLISKSTVPFQRTQALTFYPSLLLTRPTRNGSFARLELKSPRTLAYGGELALKLRP